MLFHPSSRLPVLLAILYAGWTAPPSATAADWTPLFNGADLSGWTIKCQPQDAQKSFWKVDQNTILCDSMDNPGHNYVWLLSDQEYGDFHLKLKFQPYRDSPGNSGVQIRSRFDPAASSGGWLDGPQVDIHPPADMPWRTGFLYDETRGEQRWIVPSLKNARMDPSFKPDHYIFKYADDPDNWNDLEIQAVGLHVKTILNGNVVVDWDGAGVLDNPAHQARDVGRRGHIALQLHSGDRLRIRYKDLLIKNLDQQAKP